MSEDGDGDGTAVAFGDAVAFGAMEGKTEDGEGDGVVEGDGDEEREDDEGLGVLEEDGATEGGAEGDAEGEAEAVTEVPGEVEMVVVAVGDGDVDGEVVVEGDEVEIASNHDDAGWLRTTTGSGDGRSDANASIDEDGGPDTNRCSHSVSARTVCTAAEAREGKVPSFAPPDPRPASSGWSPTASSPLSLLTSSTSRLLSGRTRCRCIVHHDDTRGSKSA